MSNKPPEIKDVDEAILASWDEFIRRKKKELEDKHLTDNDFVDNRRNPNNAYKDNYPKGPSNWIEEDES